MSSPIKHPKYIPSIPCLENINKEHTIDKTLDFDILYEFKNISGQALTLVYDDMFLKLNPNLNENDNLLDEAIILCEIQNNTVYTAYFPKLNFAYPCYYEKKIEKYRIIPASGDSYSKSEIFRGGKLGESQLLCTNIVQKPVSLKQILNTLEFNIFCNKLNELFNAMFQLSKKTNFMHNDLSLYNVIFDTVSLKFVLIDFGRSYIDNVNLCKNICRIDPSNFKFKGQCPCMFDIMALTISIMWETRNNIHYARDIFEFVKEGDEIYIKIPATLPKISERPSVFLKLVWPGLIWFHAHLSSLVLDKKIQDNYLLYKKGTVEQNFLCTSFFGTSNHFLDLHKEKFNSIDYDALINKISTIFEIQNEVSGGGADQIQNALSVFNLERKTKTNNELYADIYTELYREKKGTNCACSLSAGAGLKKAIRTNIKKHILGRDRVIYKIGRFQYVLYKYQLHKISVLKNLICS